MKDNHLTVLLEDINGKAHLVVEAVSDSNRRLNAMQPIADLVPQLSRELGAVKLIATDHRLQLSNHEQRLGMLEMPSRA